MPAKTRTRSAVPSRVPAYYLGRPARFWLAALARRPTTQKSPTCAAAGHTSSAPTI